MSSLTYKFPPRNYRNGQACRISTSISSELIVYESYCPDTHLTDYCVRTTKMIGKGQGCICQISLGGGVAVLAIEVDDRANA